MQVWKRRIPKLVGMDGVVDSVEIIVSSWHEEDRPIDFAACKTYYNRQLMDYNHCGNRIDYIPGRMKDGTSRTYTHTRGIGSFCTMTYSTSRSGGGSIATFGFYFTQEARLSSYP
ncbi:predicted protein [Lichtheimia corymbifera JMRC:FSU:9682]|uniref:Uncharacterized protein n=1 Tax=Lichtheimia corymbifera JMRC:FSU:9682 TaxID=1263082 RepID=A0A068SAX3_9FUNG|nr:predicted protein [Lichtheimia corymbifera JMRC:FSU:9682]